MKRLIVISLALLVFVILAAGCSTTSTIKDHKDYFGNIPFVSAIDKDEVISILVVGKEEDEEEIGLLRTELITQFQQRGFVIRETNSTATIKLEITDIKRVGRGTRMILGALAGKAKIDIRVMIIKNNQITLTFELETESMSFTGWGGSPGTTKQVILESAEKVVKIITNW